MLDDLSNEEDLPNPGIVTSPREYATHRPAKASISSARQRSSSGKSLRTTATRLSFWWMFLISSLSRSLLPGKGTHNFSKLKRSAENPI
jgi:hypothetical protein